MSFGFSPSDVVALVDIVRKTYQGWQRACGEYADITGALDSLLIMLKRVEEEARKPGTVLIRSEDDADDLKDVLYNATPTVREISAVLERYNSLGLGKSRQKNWHKIRFGVKNINDLRVKLTQHVAAISAYLDTAGLGALTRIECGLETLSQIKDTIDALAAEIRAGRREGTVMTTHDDDEQEVWKQFRPELIGESMKSSFLHKVKPRNKEYLRNLAEAGLLEENELSKNDEGDTLSPAGLKAGASSSTVEDESRIRINMESDNMTFDNEGDQLQHGSANVAEVLPHVASESPADKNPTSSLSSREQASSQGEDKRESRPYSQSLLAQNGSSQPILAPQAAQLHQGLQAQQQRQRGLPDDQWSTTSSTGPIVPTTLNVGDWFEFFGIPNGDISALSTTRSLF